MTPANPEEMQQLLHSWVSRGWLRALDAQLPLSLHQIAAEPRPLIWLLTALLCHQYGRGHSCIVLSDLVNDADALLSLPPENHYNQSYADRPAQLLAGLSVAQIETALQQSPWLQPADQAPLVLAQQRLYLRRLYLAEQSVMQHISARLNQRSVVTAPVKAALQQLFPLSANPESAQAGIVKPMPDWQKLACVMAVQRQFAIITGGPGTGKTTTVVKLLALLQRDAPATLRIKLAAPTGKAAVRLTESITGAVQHLPHDWQQTIPTEVTTLHKLLGAQPNRRSFKHNVSTPLALDVLVIDEASMVDLEMMAAVLDALPTHAKLILLGDKDQLASVEAGSVLGDLCRGAEQGGYDATTLAMLQPYSDISLAAQAANNDSPGTILNQATVMLRYSHRFGSQSGIGQLAAAVNRGDSSAAVALFAQFNDIHRLSQSQLRETAVNGYRHYLQLIQQDRSDTTKWAQAVLAGYSRFQLLCALRKGEWGVEGLNDTISRWLAEEGLIAAERLWYEGRPVMVQRNNYNLGLMNGDIGITLRDPASGTLKVVFNVADSGLRWVLPSRLSDIATVFAMTVHKSQGSEFQHCTLVLPPTNSPVLTRELIYTGITRARECFSLLAPDGKLLAQAIANRVSRSSGL